MDLSVLTVQPPPSRVEPVGRQIFGNASGMVSSQDLTQCLKYNQYVRKSKDPGILKCNICIRKSSSSVYHKVQFVNQQMFLRSILCKLSKRFLGIWTFYIFYDKRKDRREKKSIYLPKAFRRAIWTFYIFYKRKGWREKKSIYLRKAFGPFIFLDKRKGGKKSIYLPGAFPKAQPG